MLVSETSGYEYATSLSRQVDPTPAQWEKLIAAIKKQNLVPILDNAYQGSRRREERLRQSEARQGTFGPWTL